MIPTSLSPPTIHHCTHQFCVEPPFLEQACANESSPPLSPPGAHAQNIHSVLTEDTKSHHIEPIFASSGIKSEFEPPDIPSNQIAQCKAEAEPASSREPVEAGAGEHHPRKRKLQCHARRISINVKTGEVVERTPEGRYGVYEL